MKAGASSGHIRYFGLMVKVQGLRLGFGLSFVLPGFRGQWLFGFRVEVFCRGCFSIYLGKIRIKRFLLRNPRACRAEASQLGMSIELRRWAQTLSPKSPPTLNPKP